MPEFSKKNRVVNDIQSCREVQYGENGDIVRIYVQNDVD